MVLNLHLNIAVFVEGWRAKFFRSKRHGIRCCRAQDRAIHPIQNIRARAFGGAQRGPKRSKRPKRPKNHLYKRKAL
jgi:hypothetical protein